MNSNVTKQLFNQLGKDNYTQEDLNKMSQEERRKVLRERLHKKTGVSQMQRSGKKNMMKIFENIQDNGQINSEVANLMNSTQLSKGQKKKLRQKMRQESMNEVITTENKEQELNDSGLNIQNKIMGILNDEDSYESDED
jgi:type II secretory ATPase GspE/PulE/Tfp pilus assembly ATPase PilB-like protein